MYNNGEKIVKLINKDPLPSSNKYLQIKTVYFVSPNIQTHT